MSPDKAPALPHLIIHSLCVCWHNHNSNKDLSNSAETSMGGSTRQVTVHIVQSPVISLEICHSSCVEKTVDRKRCSSGKEG